MPIRRKIGSYLRDNHPSLYASYLKMISPAPSFYIVDYLGGSFKDYFKTENLNEKTIALEKNLDSYSVHTVETLIKRFLNYPDARFNVRMKVKEEEVIGGLLEEETIENKKQVAQNLSELRKKYAIPKALMEPSVFYYYHGLTYTPSAVADYIKNTDFIDLGAYNGDSALALSKYDYSKIYSVEMSLKSIEKYKKLMEQNHIAPSKYETINAAIAAKDNMPPIIISDSGDSNLSIDSSGKNGISVEQKTLDTLVKEYNINPKLIKADIEGCALDMVKGAVETITKHRPVLCLAIYHNPYEFFEVKPFLESIVENYTYIIRKLTISPFIGSCHGETTLVAYPNEILIP